MASTSTIEHSKGESERAMEEMRVARREREEALGTGLETAEWRSEWATRHEEAAVSDFERYLLGR